VTHPLVSQLACPGGLVDMLLTYRQSTAMLQHSMPLRTGWEDHPIEAVVLQSWKGVGHCAGILRQRGNSGQSRTSSLRSATRHAQSNYRHARCIRRRPPSGPRRRFAVT